MRLKILIRLIRIYTPFICTLMTLLNGVYFIMGGTENRLIYITSALTGNSMLVILYMLFTSMRMCIWYKMNLICLLLVQAIGILYDFTGMEFSTYLLSVVLLSVLGVICFLIFRIFYRVTSLFLCTNRYLPKSGRH